MSGEAGGVGDPQQFVEQAMPLCATLGVDVVSLAAEAVVLRLEWRAELCTTGGLLHGGALMTLADSAGGACAFLNLPDGATATSTIESKSNFFRGLADGAATAYARPLHVGAMTVVIETEVVDDAGRALAKVIQTQAVLRPRR